MCVVGCLYVDFTVVGTFRSQKLCPAVLRSLPKAWSLSISKGNSPVTDVASSWQLPFLLTGQFSFTSMCSWLRRDTPLCNYQF